MDKTPLIPAIRYAVREMSKRGTSDGTKKEIIDEIKRGCEDPEPYSEWESSTIMEEASKIIGNQV